MMIVICNGGAEDIDGVPHRMPTGLIRWLVVSGEASREPDGRSEPRHDFDRERHVRFSAEDDDVISEGEPDRRELS
jgi:hypothetical protein